MLRFIASLSVVLATTGGALRAQSPDPIDDAKELYATAAYEEALAALKMAKDRGGPSARLADEYSAYCFLALGRREEAEAAAEAAIRANPVAPLDSRDVSPRVDEMFKQVRRRVLPELARAEYKNARDMMARDETERSVEQLVHVRQILDAAGSLGSWDDTLNDISTLVDGFLELNRAKVAEIRAAQARAAQAAAPPPAPTATPARGAAAAASAATAAAPAPVRTIFSGSDTDVVPPAAIRQQIPEITLDSPTRDTRRSGVIGVTIDEKGAVQSAVMREPISATVDAQLVKAAMSWQYKPATRNGTPVRYFKLIGISIDK